MWHRPVRPDCLPSRCCQHARRCANPDPCSLLLLLSRRRHRQAATGTLLPRQHGRRRRARRKVLAGHTRQTHSKTACRQGGRSRSRRCCQRYSLLRRQNRYRHRHRFWFVIQGRLVTWKQGFWSGEPSRTRSERYTIHNLTKQKPDQDARTARLSMAWKEI